MAIAIVQKDPTGTTWATAGPASSITSTGLGTPTTTGNRLIALATTYLNTGVTNPTISDNGSHGWSRAALGEESNSPIRFCATIDYSDPITGRSDHEVTATAAANSYFALGVMEVSGIDGASPVVDSGAGAGGSTDASTEALTLSGGTDLCLGVCSDDAGGTWTHTWSGATMLWEISTDTADRLFSSASSESPTWSNTSTAHWCAASAAFRPAGAGPDPFAYDHDGVKPWSSIWRPGRV